MKKPIKCVPWLSLKFKAIYQRKASLSYLNGSLQFNKVLSCQILLFRLLLLRQLSRYSCGSKAIPFTTVSSLSLSKKKAKRLETIIKNLPSKNYGLFSTSLTCTQKSSTSSFLLADSFLMNSLKLSKDPLLKSIQPKSKPQSRGSLISGDSQGLSTRNCWFLIDNLESWTRWGFSWC